MSEGKEYFIFQPYAILFSTFEIATLETCLLSAYKQYKNLFITVLLTFYLSFGLGIYPQELMKTANRLNLDRLHLIETCCCRQRSHFKKKKKTSLIDRPSYSSPFFPSLFYESLKTKTGEFIRH